MSNAALVVQLDVDDARPVIDLTSVDNDRLFVLRSPSKQQIEVYNATKFCLKRTLYVVGLKDHWSNGLTACVRNSCLYVSDCDRLTVYKVPTQPAADNEVLTWNVDGMPTGLSVISASCNLLVTCLDTSKLVEYTPSGTLVREISLQLNITWLRKNLPQYKEMNRRPWHAIQLTDDRFLVCISQNDQDSKYDDVVEVDSQGQVVNSYKNQPRSRTERHFQWPRHLAVDKNNEFIFVADHYNDRIVTLNCSLKYVTEMNASFDGRKLQSPRCLHLPESRSRLFVGLNGGRICVFDM
jgi:hypothetical protein